MNDIILKLNVGGKKFETYKSTILNPPDGMLARMFLSNFAKPQIEGCYFFDRNPKAFSAILEWYRTRILVIPTSMTIRQLQVELDFWGLGDKVIPKFFTAQHLASTTLTMQDELISAFDSKISPLLVDQANKGLTNVRFIFTSKSLIML